MPEGDSVFRLAHRLQFMTGRKVLATSLRVPRWAVVDFTGDTVGRVWPYGKHLFMGIGDQVLHTHLKMEGSWSVHPKGERWKKPAHTVRVLLELEGDPRPIEVVGFSLGLVDVFPLEEYPERVEYLGPDVLSEEWEAGGREEAIARILREPERPIGTALLDQKNLAGVGNEYRAEICFLCGVLPTRPVGSVDVAQVVDMARRLMWANRFSVIRVTTGDKRAGHTSYVFGRHNKPCRRCGARIMKGRLGGSDGSGAVGGGGVARGDVARGGELERITWWCPHCQT